MSIYKIILGIGVLLLFLYYLIAIAGFIVSNNVTITGDSIRIEKQCEYPQTDNPYMEGVTAKEYTAEIKQ